MTQPESGKQPDRVWAALACRRDGSQLALSAHSDITPYACLIMAHTLIVRAREIETTRTWGWQFDPTKPAALLPWKLDELENHIRRIFSEEDDALTASEAPA